MKRLVLFALVALVLPSPLVAQSRVVDIYAEMAANARRAAEARAAIRSQMLTTIFDLPVAILERRPVVVAPPVDYLRMALDYQQELAAADYERQRFAAIVGPPTTAATTPAPVATVTPWTAPPTYFTPTPTPRLGSVSEGESGCGVRPVRPVRPVGCRGEMVARCVLDANGNGHWEWICTGEN